MDLIRGALESLDSILSSARRYEPSYSSDFRQKLVEGLSSILKLESLEDFTKITVLYIVIIM